MSEIKVSEVLPECQTGFSDLRLSVGLIERDLLTQTKITGKLAEAIEKIEVMNANLVKMLAVHELKHELTCSDLKVVEDHLDTTRIDVIRLQQSGPANDVREEAQVTKTLAQLEKWKYVLMGMVLVLGWLIGHINWSVVLSFFQ